MNFLNLPRLKVGVVHMFWKNCKRKSKILNGIIRIGRNILFSKSGFSEELEELAQKEKNIILKKII